MDDEREDYDDPDLRPRWEPTRGTVIVIAFALVILVGCGSFVAFVWFAMVRK